MPNIGYILRGYDILLGNPMSTTASTDPGFCMQPIFSAKYNSGKVTADQRYNIPDGTEVLSCVGKCSMTFGSSLVAGASSYTSSLDIKVTKLYLFLFHFCSSFGRLQLYVGSYDNHLCLCCDCFLLPCDSISFAILTGNQTRTRHTTCTHRRHSLYNHGYQYEA